MTSEDLMDILACPACKSGVELKNDRACCVKCGKTYPIKNGIPVMLTEEDE